MRAPSAFSDQEYSRTREEVAETRLYGSRISI